MPSTNISFRELVRKISHPTTTDAYKRLRSGNHDDTVPLLRETTSPPPPAYPPVKLSHEETHARTKPKTKPEESCKIKFQADEKILCTADRLAVGMGLEYKKREVMLKRMSSNAGTGGGAYGRAGGGGRSGSRKH